MKIIRWIHSHMPLWVSGVYMPFVYLFREVKGLRVREHVIRGALKDGRSELQMAYYGNDERILNYWTRILFSGSPGIATGSRVPVRRVMSSASAGGCAHEVVLLELTGRIRNLVQGNKGFLLPRWVDTVLNVDESLDALENRKILRTIEEQGYTLRRSRDREDLSFFYERMFRPYIGNRHQEASVMVEYSYFLKRMRKRDSQLFFLMKEGVPQAASFNERIGGMTKFSGLGVLDGSPEIIRTGAIRALYHFMLRHYREMGVEVINFGGTGPLLSDGLTRFKRSLRAIPMNKSPYGEKSFLLIPVRTSPAVTEMLKLHPFLYLEKGRFFRALFPDGEILSDRNGFLSWMKQNQFLGTAGTKIFCRSGAERINQWISGEELAGHEVLPFPASES